MRLTELKPRFYGAGGPGITRGGKPVPARHGIGMTFDCPCGCGDRVAVNFGNPTDGGPPYLSEGQPSWHRHGADFETMTLSPSILRVPADGLDCAWHGFVTEGEIRTV